MAKATGSGWFTGGGNGGDGGDDERRARYELLITKAGGEVLKNLEKLIDQLIQTKDGDATNKLQACVGELFRRAAEYAEQGKKMEISNS